MEIVGRAMAYAFAAGAAIPAGALLARVERIRPRWLETELRHGIIAFGGGALLAAVALVLVPEGTRHLSIPAVVYCFGAGGIVFFLIDRAIERRGGSLAQLLAMMMDFVPESLALGATLTAEPSVGLLLALLIGLQNLPEGFNAFRELRQAGRSSGSTLLAFGGLSLLGPLAAWIGGCFLAERPAILGAVMLFAAGGILYLIFQDIAPQTRLERSWAPPLGAVGGFGLGLVGHLLIR